LITAVDEYWPSISGLSGTSCRPVSECNPDNGADAAADARAALTKAISSFTLCFDVQVPDFPGAPGAVHFVGALSVVRSTAVAMPETGVSCTAAGTMLAATEVTNGGSTNRNPAA
jgi:hypothetical protein